MDLKRLFVSPLAWVSLALMLFILAWIFLLGLDEYITQVKPMSANLDDPPGISALLLSALYSWAGMIMLAIMPLFTMRQLAEERVNQTLVLLKSATFIQYTNCIRQVFKFFDFYRDFYGFGCADAFVISVCYRFGLGAVLCR